LQAKSALNQQRYLKLLSTISNRFSTRGILGGNKSALQRFTRIFTSEEVDRALAQMSPMKAPGLDGFGVSFFNHHWETIGALVRGAVLDFLNHGTFDLAINATYVALIPKISPASFVHNSRPISLCNVVYNLISKVLANRLKGVLPSIISKNFG
jgi:hypothetical protein